MGFLRKVIELLLQDLPEESPKSSKRWHEIFQNRLESGGEVANWSKYIHQPFLAPPTFDIDALVSQAKARVDALDDHLWLLQTEPAYFRRHLQMLEQTTIIASFQGKLVSKELIAVEVMSELKVHWCWMDLLEHSSRLEMYTTDFRIPFILGLLFRKKLTTNLVHLSFK
jgi:hypothetical protein